MSSIALRRVASIAALGLAATAAAAAPRCDIAGEPIQWLADYCMALLQTDDEVAAGDCIQREWSRRGADACAAKRWAKAGLCRIARQRGDVDSVEHCIADRAFAGPAVKAGGVGR